MTKIRVVQIGCGKMSKYTMRYVYESGAEIVGAVDINPKVIGHDIGSIMEQRPKQVIIHNLKDLDSLLKETKPDIAIITTMSLVRDLEDILRTVVSNKVNAITTCEEAFYAENSNYKVFHEIDILAKSNGVTVTGCGYQDIFWGNLITTIAGSTHKITKIKGSSSYNVEDYGIALAKAHGAGLTISEFENDIAAKDKIDAETINELIRKGEFNPSYMWNTVGWLADKLQLHIKSINQKCVPMTNKKDIHSSTLDMNITAGMATGMSAIVTAETNEGITLVAECIGKVYDETEFDKNEWTIYGEPDTTVIVNRPKTVELTCADIVNRLPDVISSTPGFIPTSRLGEPKYRLNSLDTYL
jgi:2,4-diaminopentanoate dehydrogenase